MDYEAMIYKRTDDEKRNIIKVWESHRDTLPDDGKEIVQDIIGSLKMTIKDKKKKKKKKRKKKKSKSKKEE